MGSTKLPVRCYRHHQLLKAGVKMSGIQGVEVDLNETRTRLDDLKTRFGFSEPDRGDLENEDIEWRHGKPDYTMANYQFLRGKTQNHWTWYLVSAGPCCHSVMFRPLVDFGPSVFLNIALKRFRICKLHKKDMIKWISTSKIMSTSK